MWIGGWNIIHSVAISNHFCSLLSGNTTVNFIHSLHQELLHCDVISTNGNLNPSQASTNNGSNLPAKNGDLNPSRASTTIGSNLPAKNGVSLRTHFYQFNGDENIQEDCDPPKRPSGFPVDLIKSGFEMKCWNSNHCKWEGVVIAFVKNVICSRILNHYVFIPSRINLFLLCLGLMQQPSKWWPTYTNAVK